MCNEKSYTWKSENERKSERNLGRKSPLEFQIAAGVPNGIGFFCTSEKEDNSVQITNITELQNNNDRTFCTMCNYRINGRVKWLKREL